MSSPIKLYNFPKSGHAHRIELMLSLLNLPTELVFVDLAKGAHK
ncbi:glutathione S-transferase, partial [Paraburkholderia sp. SIMBA_049]